MILDTNIVHTPSILDSLAYRTSQSICDALGVEMGIVSVTFDESVNMQVSKARDAINQLEKASRFLGEIVDMNIYIPEVDQIHETWSSTLKDHFRVYAVDGSDAIEALRREALRLAPAKQNGQGSRDCAIWLTVLRIAREGRRVYLVTNNSRDFGQAPELSAELAAEASEETLEIVYVRSLQHFLEFVSDGSVDTSKINFEDPPRILSQSLKVHLVDVFQGNGVVTYDELIDSSIDFSEIELTSAYKVGTFTVASVSFDFSTQPQDGEISTHINGKAQAFLKFDNEFHAFRVADPADIKIISIQNP